MTDTDGDCPDILANISALSSLVEQLEQQLTKEPFAPAAAMTVFKLTSEMTVNFQRLLLAHEKQAEEQAEEQTLLSDAQLPLLTESHRWHRLIGLTAMKLRTAKQPERISALRSQLLSQLNSLRPFVEALQKSIATDSSPKSTDS